MWPHLLPVFFVLDRIHRAAGFGIEHEVETRVFTEATGIAEEGILFIVIDGSEESESPGQGCSRSLVG